MLHRLFSILIVIGALPVDNCVLGQALSIQRAGANYNIQVSASEDIPWTLQASENFHLWIDVTNDLTAPFTSLLEFARFSSRFYRLIPPIPEAPPIRIMSFGDSLTSDVSGWAGGMSRLFRPNVTF